MVQEAEANAAVDKERRAFVEARNQAEGLIHQTERTISEAGDKVSAQDKGEAEAAIAAARSAMEGKDLATLTSASERLSQVAMRIGEAMYKAQAAAGAAPAGEAPTGGASTGPGGERVVDAEFEEIDDKKKSA
jgi:molecular chaperone DnaK